MFLPRLASLVSAVLMLTSLGPAQGCPTWARFLGGNGVDHNEYAFDTMCVADNGDILVSGYTTSTNFTSNNSCPNPPNGRKGPRDGFLTRLDPAGNVRWSVLIGGYGIDGVLAVLDLAEPGGDVLIGGYTNGPTPLAATACAAQTTHQGGPQFGDGFVARLTNAVTGPPTISWLTYLGGSGDESVLTLARHPSGLVIAGGWTTSPNFPMPGPGSCPPFQPTAPPQTCSPPGDGFVAVLDPSRCGASQLVAATYFGGICNDYVLDVEVDPSGNVVLAAQTRSPNLPTLCGVGTSLGGPTDAFVAVLDPCLSTLLYGSYLGGNGIDYPYDMVRMPTGGFLLCGQTTSANFPTTPGAFQPSFAGGAIYGIDGFVLHLDPSQCGAAGLVWSTYLGGAGDDFVGAMAVEASGLVTIVGGTGSNPPPPGPAFPATAGACTVVAPGGCGLPNGPFDAFVSRLDPDVTRTGSAQLVYSTYLGGSACWEQATNVALTATGAVVVTGRTWSWDFPVTLGCPYGGSEDVFVAVMDLLPAPVVRYGAPSPPCHGPLYLGVNSQPSPGNPTFEVHANEAPPSTIGALFLGTPVTPIPIPILGIDAWVLPPPPLGVLGFTNNRGFARFPLTIPPGLNWPFGGLQTVWLGTCATFVASDALQ